MIKDSDSHWNVEKEHITLGGELLTEDFLGDMVLSWSLKIRLVMVAGRGLE